ncbi:MAG: hypothetical protein FWH27_10405 [Planctomycetaceae bacterium]|nr:hypothetical protein [Planctomycetaceae bacterium]
MIKLLTIPLDEGSGKKTVKSGEKIRTGISIIMKESQGNGGCANALIPPLKKSTSSHHIAAPTGITKKMESPHLVHELKKTFFILHMTCQPGNFIFLNNIQ